MIFTISGRSGSGRTEWITSDYLTEPDTFMTCRAPIEHGARHIPTRLDDIIILRVFYNVSAGVTRIGHRGYQELNRATNHMRSRSVDSINSLRLSPFLLLVQHPNFCHKDFCSLRAECFILAKHHDSKSSRRHGSHEKSKLGITGISAWRVQRIDFPDRRTGCTAICLARRRVCVSQTFFFLLPRMIVLCSVWEERTGPRGLPMLFGQDTTAISLFFFLRFRFSNLAAPRGTSIAWSPAREFISAKQAPPHALPEGFGIDVFICSFPTVFLASEPCFAPAKDQA